MVFPNAIDLGLHYFAMYTLVIKNSPTENSKDFINWVLPYIAISLDKTYAPFGTQSRLVLVYYYYVQYRDQMLHQL